MGKSAAGVEEWTAYGPGGEELGRYTLSAATGEFTPTLLNVWFGGRLVATQTVTGVNIGTGAICTTEGANAREEPQHPGPMHNPPVTQPGERRRQARLAAELSLSAQPLKPVRYPHHRKP